jgi:MFS family permease
VLWSTGALAMVFAVSYTFTSLYQPYLVQVGFTVAQFAYILPLMFVTEALGGTWSEKITSRLGERLAFWINILLLGASLLIMGILASKFVVPLLLAYGFVQGLLRPLLSTYANRHIEAAHRATIISVQVMMSTVVASALLFVFGFLTDRIGVIALTGLIGGLVLAAGIPLLLLRPKAAA